MNIDIYNIYLLNCNFCIDGLSYHHNSKYDFAKILLSFKNHFEFSSNVIFRVLNSYSFYYDDSFDIFKAIWLWDFMFLIPMNDELRLFTDYWAYLISEWIKSKENIGIQYQITQRAWATLLDRNKLYQNSERDLFPDHSYLFQDQYQRKSTSVDLTNRQVDRELILNNKCMFDELVDKGNLLYKT